MISKLFIERPRLALVISIIITLVGTIALFSIPVAQYPEITPPEIVVFTSYPGADAKTVASTVAAPIEAEINGVEGMLYMSSTSSNDGLYQLSVTFEVGTDPNMAQVNVQNRIQIAATKLPKEVTQQGITVRKRTSDIMAVISFFSPKGTYDSLFLSNFVSQNIKDALLRVPGVSDVFIFGELQYSMRIWLYPDRLYALKIGVDEVIAALQAQNIQAAVGAIGKSPISDGPELQFTLQSKGRLKEASEFEEIIIRQNPKGGLVRLRDVARVELGSATYNTRSLYNGSPNLGLAIYKSPEANALKAMKEVINTLEGLKKRMPEDIQYKVIYDTTKYVEAAVEEIRWTLLLTFLLVILVTYIFLQDWRATLIPTIAVPVSLIGTFAVLLGLGYTANTISLFALIMAIGLVVDDAIVVVENVYRILEEEGLGPKEAAYKAMKQVTGPIIATTLVLLAVFVPVAFMPGITGRLYKEFAVTLCTSVVISSINALTLSPALCRVFFKEGTIQKEKRGPLGWFNRGLWAWRGFYISASGWLIRRIAVPVVVFLLVVLSALFIFKKTPSSFLPDEDQGVFYLNFQLPEGANLNRTVKVAQEITNIIKGMEGVEGVLCVPGFSILSGTAENVGFGIVVLRPWNERKSKELSVNNILKRAQGALMGISSANIVVFGPPAIRGLGRTGGFDLRLLALRDQDPREMASVAMGTIVAANQDPRLERVFTTFSADTPQIYLEIDRIRAESMGVPVSEIFSTLQGYLGSRYVNDFNLAGRVYQVRIQAEEGFRIRESDILNLYVRSKSGSFVPLQNLVELKHMVGPQLIYRYNQYQSLQINGQGKAGISSGEAMKAMEEILGKSLPEGYGYEWSSMSFQEKRVKGQVVYLFLLALLFGYLFLVAQYESFTIPVPIILYVSVSTLGGLLGLWVLGLNMSIYAQIGIVLLVGLASKNAILIVEFSKDLRQEGRGIMEAALEGAKIRFRPVLMTAFTFIMGVAPMVFAKGAGAQSRIHVGATVVGGMLLATVIGIFLIPSLYYIFEHLRERIHMVRRYGLKAGIKAAVIIASLCALQGCTSLITPIKAPEPKLSSSYRSQEAIQKHDIVERLDPDILAEWWKELRDPLLVDLVETAIKENLDLRVAIQRVKEAKAKREAQGGELYPVLSSSGSFAESKGSRSAGTGKRTDLYKLGVDASWELDLFGGISSGIEAKEREYRSQTEALKSTLVSLIGEVALNYVQLRTLQKRLSLNQKNIQLQEETLRLNESKYKAGLIDELAVEQSRYNLNATKAQAHVLRAEIENTINNLGVLLGKQPRELNEKLKNEKEIPLPPEKVMIGIPADVLRNRPDIKKAEWDIYTQAAYLGVAKAELYPHLNLKGTFGLESFYSKDLFDWPSRVWSVISSLSYVIFKGGTLKANVRAQEAKVEQALNIYQKTLLTALKEVEDALSGYMSEKNRIEDLKGAVGAAQRALELAISKYDAGLVDFINVLETERTLQSLEDQLAQSQGNLVGYVIKIYKALGGGWQKKAEGILNG